METNNLYIYAKSELNLPSKLNHKQDRKLTFISVIVLWNTQKTEHKVEVIQV